MSAEATNPTEPIQRLRDWFARGQVVLFTGAGFSYGAQDIAGRSVPQVKDLAAELWRIAYPDRPYDAEADIGDLYEVALSRARRGLTSLLKARLDVDPASLADYFALYFSMPWRIMYTVNIDNLEEAADRSFDLPRSIRPISGLTGDIAIGGGAELMAIHLNGLRDEIPDVTFGPLQYGRRNAIPEALYGQMVSDILTFPVVFVGTELRESPLWKYVALRGAKGPRGVEERRLRSFLVSPSLPAERAELLDRFNITWLKMTAEQFAVEVLAKLDDVKRQGHQVIQERARAARERVRLQSILELAALPSEPVSEYLLGARPTWGDITSGRAVEREFERTIEPLNLPACLVINGTAGAGTSTTLMQLALRCATAGLNALWLTAREGPAHEVSREIRRFGDKQATIFIDDADLLGRGLESLTRDVGSTPNISLVLGLRSGRLDDVLGGWRPEDAGGLELVVPGLEDADVDRLLDSLDRDNKLGELKGMPRERQHTVLVRGSGRQLLVAMIKATSGAELEEKVVSEMNMLGQPHQTMYAILAIVTQLRHTLARDEILTSSDALSNEGVAALDRLVARRLVTVANERYELRHRLVAEIAVTALRQERQAFGPYLGLARMLASKHRIGDRTSRVGRLLIALINHRKVSTFFALAQAQQLFQELEGFLADDYHFLLQRGSYELDHGSLWLATNYLQQARNLGGGDHRVETEWAHLLMRKACADPGGEKAVDLVEEARAILLSQIDRFGSSDRYSFHVYGSQILSWTRACGLGIDAQRRELKQALELVEAGRAAHPGDRDLSSLCQSLKRELLMTAVGENDR